MSPTSQRIPLNNQSFMSRPTLIDLNPDEYNQGLCYYPFIVNLDRCHCSFSTFSDPSGKTWVVNKTEDISLNIFNMVKRISESKALTKPILCECKWKFNGRKCHSS